MTSDPLDGFRPKKPLDSDEAMFEKATRGFTTQEIVDAANVAIVREFWASEVGRLIAAKVDEAERQFMAVSMEVMPGSKEMVEAHHQYRLAMQSMMWLGEVVAAGMDAEAQIEERLREAEREDAVEAGDDDA